MKNLAGVKDCDRFIREELTRAEIEVVEGERSTREVAASLTGRLGPITFERAWTYWVTNGRVPLAVAQELYAHPEGRRTVRVAGHCRCPPPEAPWIDWIAPDGREVIGTDQRAGFEELAKPGRWTMGEIDAQYIFCDDPESIGAKPYVDGYHIDDQAGLLLFSQAIRRHGLDREGSHAG